MTSASARFRIAYQCYRYYDATGRLLYVGSTARPRHREASHRRHSPWWPQVDESKTRRIEYDSMDECATAEVAAYDDEHPLHNLIRPAYRGIRGPRVFQPPPVPEFDWRDGMAARRIIRERAQGPHRLPQRWQRYLETGELPGDLWDDYPGDIDPADIVEPTIATGRSTAGLTFPAPGG